MASAEPARSTPKADVTEKSAEPEAPPTPTEVATNSPIPNPPAGKTIQPKLAGISSKTNAEHLEPDKLGNDPTATAPPATAVVSLPLHVKDLTMENEKFNSPADGITLPTDDIANGTQTSPPPKPSPDIYIALMGQTGTGKTSFIRDATGRDDLEVGHDLVSCTQNVNVVDTTIGGRNVKLIDTPGFDDSGRSDADILKIISKYLQASYTNKIYLTGIIYVQRITDNRMQGSSVRCLRLLKQLCGLDYYGNIVLVTTMWDETMQKDGERRESQLRTTEGYWSELIKHGATFRRHHPRGKDSAIEVIEHLLEKTPAVLKFQRELFDKHGIIADTSAGQELMMFYAKKLEDAERRIEEALKELNESQRVITSTKEELEKSIKEREKLEAQVKKENEELEARIKKEREDLEAGAKKEREKLEADLEKQKAALEAEAQREKEGREALEAEVKREKEEREALGLEIKILTEEVLFNSERVKILNEALEEKAKDGKLWPNCPVQ